MSIICSLVLTYCPVRVGNPCPVRVGNPCPVRAQPQSGTTPSAQPSTATLPVNSRDNCTSVSLNSSASASAIGSAYSASGRNGDDSASASRALAWMRAAARAPSLPARASATGHSLLRGGGKYVTNLGHGLLEGVGVMRPASPIVLRRPSYYTLLFLPDPSSLRPDDTPPTAAPLADPISPPPLFSVSRLPSRRAPQPAATWPTRTA